MKDTVRPLILLFAALLMAGCATKVPADQKEDQKLLCTRLIEALDKELEEAEGEVLADAGPFTKATTLLAGASLQRQFGRYASCIDKARRGRALIAPYLKKK